MKKPAALTSRVASACSAASCFRTSGTWSRSVSSAVMPHALPFCDNASTAASTLSWSRPVITAVPPPATTWWAVARPMPLLPPTTTALRPSKLALMTVVPSPSDRDLGWQNPVAREMRVVRGTRRRLVHVGQLSPAEAHGRRPEPSLDRTGRSSPLLRSSGGLIWMGSEPTSRKAGEEHAVIPLCLDDGHGTRTGPLDLQLDADTPRNPCHRPAESIRAEPPTAPERSRLTSVRTRTLIGTTESNSAGVYFAGRSPNPTGATRWPM